jgi:inhibitor of cysteine peptidase
MRIRIGMTVVAVVAAGVLAACEPWSASAESATAEKENKVQPIDITKANDGNSVAVPLGREARIRLEGNPTTGYSWFLAGIDGNSVEAKGQVTYAPKPHAPGIVGSGGVFELLLRAAKAGKSTVRMEYKRPWEKDTPPIETFKVTVDVKPAEG